MKKVFKISLIVIIIGAFIGTFFYLYKQSKEKPKVFQTKEPFYTDIVKKTVATGEVVPRKEIEIKPQVSGIVHKLYVEPGDQVKEGDLIAKVKIIPNMVELNRAQSRVKRQKSIMRMQKQTSTDKRKYMNEGLYPRQNFRSTK